MARHMAQAPEPKRRVPVAAIVVGAVLVVGIAVGVFALLPKQGAPASGAQGAEGANDGDQIEVLETSDESEGEDTAVEEPKTEVARMLQNHEVTSIRLVGDSITAGFGTDGYEDANLTGTGTKIYDDGEDVYYETPASVQCWANAFRTYVNEHGVKSFVNAGINGAFMKGLSDNPDAWLGNGADIIFVALGTNDAGYYGPEQYRASAERGLAAAAEKSKVVVVLSPVRDLRPESQLVEPAGELGDILAGICEENGYVFVDPRDAVTASMFNEDGLHPTTEGSLAIWACIQKTLGL